MALSEDNGLRMIDQKILVTVAQARDRDRRLYNVHQTGGQPVGTDEVVTLLPGWEDNGCP